MASWWTNKGKVDSWRQNPETVTLRTVLVNTRPASAAAAADLNFVADITAGEIAGQRQTLAGATITEDDANDRGILSANPLAQITGLNGPTIKGFWVFRRVGGADADATDILWCFIELPDIVTNGTPVNVAWPPEGVSTIV